MSLRLKLAEARLPEAVRRRYFRRLVELTARAFEAPPPPRTGRGAEAERLAYARFTHEQASRLAPDGEARARAERRLFDEASRLGRRLRRLLGVRTRAEAMRAARLLYRAIGIDFRGEASGEIRIAACSFADLYSPDTCRLLAAADAGILAGLAGSGRLSFSSRISEGAPACRARFEIPGEET